MVFTKKIKGNDILFKNVFLILSLSVNILLLSLVVYVKGGPLYVLTKVGLYHPIKPVHNNHYFARSAIYDVFPVEQGDIVFIGNSLTENCPWNELFPDLKIKNRGIGGDWTQGILERIGAIAKNKPAKLFLEIGLEDLNGARAPRYVVLQNFEAIFDTIRNCSPETRLYVQSLLPVEDKACSRHMAKKSADIISLNRQLKELTEKHSLVFIDLFSFFTATDNQLNPAYSQDGGHINGKGYLLWKSIVEKYVRE